MVFWLVLVVIGVLVGDRYGVPGFVTGVTDRGFELIESQIGGDQEENEVSKNGGASNGAAPATPAPAAASSGGVGAASNAGLKINDAGLQIIKDSEGLRLEAYELGGRWYIGYGHAATARAGMKITEAEADQLLRQDVTDAENAVRRMVTVPVNTNQFSAMVSLAYNLGAGGFSRTTVLERINQLDYSGAADGFLNHNKAGGKVLDHLTHRREKERALFLTPA